MGKGRPIITISEYPAGIGYSSDNAEPVHSHRQLIERWETFVGGAWDPLTLMPEGRVQIVSKAHAASQRLARPAPC